MSGHKTGERSDLGEQAHLVHLGDYGIQHLAFERAKHNGLVLDRIESKAPALLQCPQANIIDCGHSNHKTILPSASSLHFSEQLFLHGVQEVGTKVSWMQQYLML